MFRASPDFGDLFAQIELRLSFHITPKVVVYRSTECFIIPTMSSGAGYRWLALGTNPECGGPQRSQGPSTKTSLVTTQNRKHATTQAKHRPWCPVFSIYRRPIQRFCGESVYYSLANAGHNDLLNSWSSTRLALTRRLTRANTELPCAICLEPTPPAATAVVHACEAECLIWPSFGQSDGVVWVGEEKLLHSKSSKPPDLCHFGRMIFSTTGYN